MNYHATVGYLYSLQKFGMKFGLENTRKLLAALGNPERSFRSVHIAGTNGKGSTAAATEAILRTSGAVTGMFTSPHLISFTERIRVRGVEISEQDVVSLAGQVRETAAQFPDFRPTFFEVVTAMAFLHFRKAGVQWAVVETGLGGRLDATNVIAPEATVITNIGLDHRDFLGTTLAEIAAEKAGIIKPGVPLITAVQEQEAAGVILHAAEEKSAPVYRYGADFRSELRSNAIQGIAFDYSGVTGYGGLEFPLGGAYQAVNASLAIKTGEALAERHPGLTCDVRSGLRLVRWPGRLEIAKAQPPVLIDGAHNPDAACALAATLDQFYRSEGRRIILILGIMADKDIEGIMKPLLPLASEIIFTAAAYGRAASAAELAARARSLGYAARETSSVAEALTRAEELRGNGDLVVVTGSFYTIGEAREALGSTGVLTRLRE